MVAAGSGPLACEREEGSGVCLHSGSGKNPGGELTRKTEESLKDVPLLASERRGHAGRD